MSASSPRMSEREDPRLEAAQRRLRESVNRADTLEAIREIVTNLLGCEEIGLFTVAAENDELLWSFGIDPERHGTLASFEEAALHRVLNGEFHIAQVAHDDRVNYANPPLRVFVPILWKGRTAAVLVMVKMLPQKVAFDEADLNLVKVLSEEAGGALFDRSANAGA